MRFLVLMIFISTQFIFADVRPRKWAKEYKFSPEREAEIRSYPCDNPEINLLHSDPRYGSELATKLCEYTKELFLHTQPWGPIDNANEPTPSTRQCLFGKKQDGSWFKFGIDDKYGTPDGRRCFELISFGLNPSISDVGLNTSFAGRRVPQNFFEIYKELAEKLNKNLALQINFNNYMYSRPFTLSPFETLIYYKSYFSPPLEDLRALEKYYQISMQQNGSEGALNLTGLKNAKLISFESNRLTNKVIEESDMGTLEKLETLDLSCNKAIHKEFKKDFFNKNYYWVDENDVIECSKKGTLEEPSQGFTGSISNLAKAGKKNSKNANISVAIQSNSFSGEIPLGFFENVGINAYDNLIEGRLFPKHFSAKSNHTEVRKNCMLPLLSTTFKMAEKNGHQLKAFPQRYNYFRDGYDDEKIRNQCPPRPEFECKLCNDLHHLSLPDGERQITMMRLISKVVDEGKDTGLSEHDVDMVNKLVKFCEFSGAGAREFNAENISSCLNNIGLFQYQPQPPHQLGLSLDEFARRFLEGVMDLYYYKDNVYFDEAKTKLKYRGDLYFALKDMMKCVNASVPGSQCYEPQQNFDCKSCQDKKNFDGVSSFEEAVSKIVSGDNEYYLAPRISQWDLAAMESFVEHCELSNKNFTMAVLDECKMNWSAPVLSNPDHKYTSITPYEILKKLHNELKKKFQDQEEIDRELTQMLSCLKETQIEGGQCNDGMDCKICVDKSLYENAGRYHFNNYVAKLVNFDSDNPNSIDPTKYDLAFLQDLARHCGFLTGNSFTQERINQCAESWTPLTLNLPLMASSKTFYKGGFLTVLYNQLVRLYGEDQEKIDLHFKKLIKCTEGWLGGICGESSGQEEPFSGIKGVLRGQEYR